MEKEFEGNSPPWFNLELAELVLNYVKDLVNGSKRNISTDEIGIIAPYARQTQKIRNALKVAHISYVKFVSWQEILKGGSVPTFIMSTLDNHNISQR